MIITEAKLDDVLSIVNLWTEFMKEHDNIVISENPKLEDFQAKDENMEKNYEDFLKSTIESSDGKVFLALDNDEIAGFTLISIKDEIPIYKNKKIGRINDLYVKKGHRGRAISSALKDRSLEWFKSKGINSVSIPMYPDNKHAHSVYKKWGFFDYKVEMRKKI